MKKLIDNGAKINSHGLDDLTPLINAIQKNRYEAVRLLLDAGADPNLTSGDLGPLFFALYEGRGEISLLLMQRGGKLVVPSVVGDRFRDAVCPRAKENSFKSLLERAGYIC